MKQVHLHGKAFDNDDFKRLVIGGQTNADTIRFVIPKIYGGEIDFSGDDWVWSITYENREGQGDTALLAKSLSNESENVYLDWKPSQTATQVEGKLVCQVFGVKKQADGTVTHRFTCAPFSIYVEEWLNPDPITQSLPTVIEQALEIMAEYNSKLENAFDARDTAVGSARIAERYAKGSENGKPVSSGVGYQDNSKYYADQASKSVQDVNQAKSDALDELNAAVGTAPIGTSPGSGLLKSLSNHAEELQGNLDKHIAEKTSESEQTIANYVEKTSKPAINEYVSGKQSTFDQHVEDKTGEFDRNAASKSGIFNQNATEKQKAFDDHVSQKTTDLGNYAESLKPALQAYVDTASEQATLATQKASAAAASATVAKTSENNANASKTAAANSASAAKTSENNANASKTAAANSASAAKTSENNANASKTAAANSASAAKTSENNAAKSASEVATIRDGLSMQASAYDVL